MGFRVIKGTFHIVGYSPDGDSIRFKAENENNWSLLDGREVKLNAKGHAQLRIEAVDTLETHYKRQNQPLKFATAATEKLFKLLGISKVVWNESRSRVKSAKDGQKGYIISRMAERYGRPVAFVYSTNIELQDGQEIFLDKKIARKSVNYKMLRYGLAYPTFYDGLFYDLRELFAYQTQKVRKLNRGVWASDKTNEFIKINGLTDMIDTHVVIPKLFRRVVAHILENGSFNGGKFLEELERKKEKVFVLRKLHFTHFDNVLEIDQNGKIRLTEKPEDLVFIG